MKILFISHDAFRAGAQILLLHFLKWMQTSQKEVQVDTILIEGGVLKPQFEALSNTLYVYSNFKEEAKTLKRKIGQIINPDHTKPFLFKTLKHQNYDLIYANSVASLPLGIHLKQILNCKLLLHVHELQSVIQECVPNFSSMVHDVDIFVSASQMVKDNLVKNHAIAPKHIKVVYEFSKVDDLVSVPKQDNHVFTVGGSGSMSYRKGFDLFLKTAIDVKKEYPNYNIRFMWVGGGSEEKKKAESEIEKVGLKNSVIFTGEQENPSYHFQMFDVFLLSSREDPFPLVCIEAAQMGKPIMCFEGTTGSTEILSKGGGYIAPYLDIEAIKQKILEYYGDRKLLEQDGTRAKALFSKFTPDEICPELFSIITSLITEK